MRKRLFCAYMSLIGVLVFILRFRSFYFEYDHCRASENGCSTVEPTDSPKTLLIVEQTFRPSSSVKQKYLENVYISIKSTAKYHYSRLNLLFLTWFETVPPQNVQLFLPATQCYCMHICIYIIIIIEYFISITVVRNIIVSMIVCLKLNLFHHVPRYML